MEPDLRPPRVIQKPYVLLVKRAAGAHDPRCVMRHKN
jgi:hypothetical protein